jgi:hypothetical protein
MKKILVQENAVQQSRHDALAQAELKIKKASADTLDSIRIIGRELIGIEEDNLWEIEGYDDFKTYVEIHLHFSWDLAKRWMRVSQAFDLLDQAKLQLPINESQVIELAKIKEPGTLVAVWERILDFATANKAALTHDLVRGAVNEQRTKAGTILTRAIRKKKGKAPKGISIDLEGNGAPKTVKGLSDKGEIALNRIRRYCGDAYADAILGENVNISEGDLIKWAEETSEMIKNLGYWIVIKRWSLRKALAYEENSVDGDTKVHQLGDLARSRGGRVYAEFEDLKITVEIAEAQTGAE